MSGAKVVAAFAGLAFRDAIRTKWLLIFTAIYFLVLINVPFLILLLEGVIPASSLASYVVYLGSVSFPFLPLLSLPLGALTIVEERESGTLQYLFSTRLTRMEFLLGRYIGMLAATSLVVVGGFALVGLVMLNVGASPFAAVGVEAGVSLALNLVMLTLALVISVASRRRVTALSVAILTWFLLLLLSDFGATFGLIVTLPNGTFVEVLAALLNPVETAGLLSEMTLNAYGPQLGPTSEILKNYFGGPSTGAHTALTLMGLSLAAWVVVTFALMVALFRRMDLA